MMARTKVTASKVMGSSKKLREKMANAKASGKKNYARKTAGEPCTRKTLVVPSLMDVDVIEQKETGEGEMEGPDAGEDAMEPNDMVCSSRRLSARTSFCSNVFDF